MGIGYLDRFVIERDARFLGEGGRGKGHLRVDPDGHGYFKCGWGGSAGGSEEYEPLLLHSCLPRRTGWGV